MASKPRKFSILPIGKLITETSQKSMKMEAKTFILITEEQLEEKIYSAVESALRKFGNEMRPMSPEVPEDRNLPIPELCTRWNVSKGTIHNYIKQGLITPMKLGRRILFPMSEVMKAEANGLTRFRGGR